MKAIFDNIQNALNFRILGVFEKVFCTEHLEMISTMDFDMFFGILIFDPKWGFCMGYSLYMMADFQNGLISRIFSVFWSGFFTEQLKMISRMDFDMFFGILIFDPKWGFCMGYSLCMMAEFQNGLISRIVSIFWSAFLQRNLKMICRIDFDMFFGILIFYPKWGF